MSLSALWALTKWGAIKKSIIIIIMLEWTNQPTSVSKLAFFPVASLPLRLTDWPCVKISSSLLAWAKASSTHSVWWGWSTATRSRICNTHMKKCSSSSSAQEGLLLCLHRKVFFVKLQALAYDILPSTTAIFNYITGSWKLSANEQFFVGAQTVVSLLQTTQIISEAQIKPKPFESRWNFFFTLGGCVWCLHVCLRTRLLLRSY